MSAGKASIFTLIFISAIYGTLYGICATENNKDEHWAKALPQVAPSENECRPYIEKAIKKLTSDGATDGSSDNDETSTDEDENEGVNSASDGENIPSDCINSTDRQSQEEKDAETPTVQISEINDDGEEVPVSVEEDASDSQNDESSEEAEVDNSKEDEKEDDNLVNSDTKNDINNKEDDVPDISSNSLRDKNNDGRREDKQSDEEISESNESEEETSSDNIAENKPSIQDADNEDDDRETNNSDDDDEDEDSMPEEELAKGRKIPKVLRSRSHIDHTLQLEKEDSLDNEKIRKLTDHTLKELKKIYDSAIKPMETLYKYRDLSNRHFGDPEIFSKPLILFMGPWSGGKSTIINYLLENEFSENALRSGAEPSPAYFNILTHNENVTVLDGTQLAADWTFSGLQKFGQGLLDRLRGLQLPHPLLEKVNIVEIPGILEIRKQVERMFPFNDACQWFIDRADIIFLVYDPAKLDVGPETEAILDQLKGREYQTRIILNKADQVRAEELMRIQGTLIWNISPLMSSIEPPIMYSTSLWSLPYEKEAPSKLLHSQEVAFLKDLRNAIDKRVENKISSARRFAVRVRNHAKMVDCYLTTYYNHKSFFGNRKKINDDIIEHPQNYHIYEGLSTLTNISRYDLPDPDVYKDFFRLHPIYEFQKLSDTCTYFRGCPINRLDIAIAYDLPELVGKYKKSLESIHAGTDKPAVVTKKVRS